MLASEIMTDTEMIHFYINYILLTVAFTLLICLIIHQLEKRVIRLSKWAPNSRMARRIFGKKGPKKPWKVKSIELWIEMHRSGISYLGRDVPHATFSEKFWSLICVLMLILRWGLTIGSVVEIIGMVIDIASILIKA